MAAHKLYFRRFDDEVCYPAKYHIENMKAEGLKELEVIEARAIWDSQYFFCRAVGEVGDSEGCGKMCDDYSPCNGKNGRCRHKGKLYEPTETKILLTTPQGLKFEIMEKIIVSSAALKRHISVFIKSLIAEPDNYVVKVKCENKILYFETFGLNIESKENWNIDIVLGQLRKLHEICGIIEEQPLVVMFNNSHSWIEIKEILI